MANRMGRGRRFAAPTAHVLKTGHIAHTKAGGALIKDASRATHRAMVKRPKQSKVVQPWSERGSYKV